MVTTLFLLDTMKSPNFKSSNIERPTVRKSKAEMSRLPEMLPSKLPKSNDGRPKDMHNRSFKNLIVQSPCQPKYFLPYPRWFVEDNLISSFEQRPTTM